MLISEKIFYLVSGSFKHARLYIEINLLINFPSTLTACR
ncbi:MAG: hypothetical protein K0S32_1376 [Bacteroidetes bacterium]|jgi:hypothetical protein|nr:hypothetical protein [Bacteroidota bacterium]